MNMPDDREFSNPFLKDAATDVLDAPNKLKKEYHTSISSCMKHLLAVLEERLNRESDRNDYSVYTGESGISVLYLLLHRLYPDDGYLSKALEFVEPHLSRLKGHRVTFLAGDAGPLAVASVIYHWQGKDREYNHCIKKIVQLLPIVLDLRGDLPDELLYGRAGYLFSLLLIKKHIPGAEIQDDLITQVVTQLIESGKNLSRREKSKCPLMYQWHGKAYVGAAHGLAGIFYMLLQARAYVTEEDLQLLIKPSIDYVLSLKFPSGNFPSSLENTSDRLIHWCHGAPGVVHLMALSYKVYNDEKYLLAAQRCADVIWERGLLKKGYGLCHGVAGNAYGFLGLFQLTSHQLYLYRAVKFAEWCFDYGKHGCRTPDRPLSLFEGLAGTVYFLADLLSPDAAAFPAFQLA